MDCPKVIIRSHVLSFAQWREAGDIESTKSALNLVPSIKCLWRCLSKLLQFFYQKINFPN